jgi:hypothetical protein
MYMGMTAAYVSIVFRWRAHEVAGDTPLARSAVFRWTAVNAATG